MNRFAYRSTGFAIKTLSNLSKANIVLHGQENIPDGSIIFVINHFTRIETFLMPYQIFTLTGVPVWSLADYELFQGAFGNYLEKVGALSTKSPDRDRLIDRGRDFWLKGHRPFPDNCQKSRPRSSYRQNIADRRG